MPTPLGSAHERTPHGAFKRTAHGAFRGLLGEPVSDLAFLDGTIAQIFSDLIGQYFVAGDPDWNYVFSPGTGAGFVRTTFGPWTINPTNDPTHVAPLFTEFVPYTIIGQTSGTRFQASIYAPTFGYNGAQTVPGGTAYGGPNPLPTPTYSMLYKGGDVVTSQSEMFFVTQPAGFHPPFIQGEAVIAYPEDKVPP